MQGKELLSEKRLRESETDKNRKANKDGCDLRIPVESDYGRVVFCSAFRRLHDKTQVFPLTTNDNIHSRLTHSMEVASVGRSLSLRLLKNEKVCDKFGLDNTNPESWRKLTTLIEVVCLAHDIGNPPFGHFGETIIQNYFDTLCREIRDKDELISEQGLAILNSEKLRERNKKLNDFAKCRFFMSGTYLDYTQFDGNAEGFRVLTRLQFLDDLCGLNLTSASLCAFLKYPNIGEGGQDKISCHKHGVFTTEIEILEKVMKDCGIKAFENGNYYDRHPVSFIMEAADTICYRIMDIEDAITKGWISYDEVRDLIKDDRNTEMIILSLDKHCKEGCPTKKRIVQLRTEMMSVMVDEAAECFVKNIDKIFDGSYDEELLDNTPSGLEKKLKNLCLSKIYDNKEIQTLELTGEAVLTGLLNYYIKYLFHEDKKYRMHCKRILSRSIFMATLQEHLDQQGEGKKAWDEFDKFDPIEMDFEEKLRIIRDHVACMTDQYALEQYRRLMGIAL